MPSLFACVGVSFLDRVFRVASLPLPAGKQRAEQYVETGGGVAATAAVTIARLGGSCAYWGRVGTDTAGDAVLSELAREGVDVAGVRRVAGARTQTSAILVAPDGERAVVADFDPALDPDAAFLPLDRIRGLDGLMSDSRWPAGNERALAAARAAGVPTVLDLEPGPRDVNRTLCALADHAIFSEPGLAGYAGCDEPEAALEEVFRERGKVVAVTLGEKGVLLRSGPGLTHVPAPKVTAVDTTGAGDAFHGAYLVGIVETRNPVAAARFACAVAALKCTRLGGRAGLPTRAEVAAFMAANPS